MTPAPAQPANEDVAILEKADRARGNLEGVTWTVVIHSEERGRTREITVAVRSRGYNFLGEMLSPPKSKGQELLMVSGTMWFHKPGLSKPVPISRRQRLMGQASYGDIAATNYAHEYAAETMEDDAVAGESCRVFDLRARNKKTTYDHIRYWISKSRGVGLRAEYFTVSGKLIKTALMEYAPVRDDRGRKRLFITKLVITDALIDGDVTTLTFQTPSFRKLPDRIFNVALFGR